jgi:hypothetical protein
VFLSEDEKSSYYESLFELEKSFEQLENAFRRPGPNQAEKLTNHGPIFEWPFRMHDQFFGSLERREPVALILLAFYCAILKYFDSLWFVSQRAQTLLAEIAASLAQEYMSWLDWPRQFTIGL